MRTLLRHTRTGLYFQGPERWTADPQNAYDFRFTERALQYVATWDLTEVELAFAFEETQAMVATAALIAAPQHATN
jgi:hypothetical protein